jgi:hypothetical protein
MERRDIARKFLKENFSDSYFELWKCYHTTDNYGMPTAFIVIGTFFTFTTGIEGIIVGESENEIKEIVLNEPEDFPIDGDFSNIEIIPYKGYYVGIYYIGEKYKRLMNKVTNVFNELKRTI